MDTCLPSKVTVELREGLLTALLLTLTIIATQQAIYLSYHLIISILASYQTTIVILLQTQ